jgi:hypothetical protein
MRPRRIYLPLTHDQLRTLAADRVLAAPVTGYAAAAPGRVDARISPTAAQEEAEYVAFRAAAREATLLSGGARRVVAAADAPDGSHRETSADGTRPVAVVTTEDLPLRNVVSLHLDEDTAEAGAGADAVAVTEDDGTDADGSTETDADADVVVDVDVGGETDAETDVETDVDQGDIDTSSEGDDGKELDLLWYDITELDAVLDELRR